MGLLTFGALVVLVVYSMWTFITHPEERAKMISEVREEPFGSLVVFTMIVCIFMFVLGIFIPALGKADFIGTGWQVWRIGGLGALACFVIVGVLQMR
jgi:hypothetical protein